MGARASLDLDLGLEWAALELLAGRPAPRIESDLLPRLLRSPELRLDRLVAQATRHRLVCRLAAYLDASGIEDVGDATLRQSLRTLLNTNRQRTVLLRDEAARIAQALGQRGVRFACTKGIVFESALYGADGSRMMRDLDFMIRPEDRPAVVELMTELGFRPGRYHEQRRTIELDRRTELTYRLNPDHLPHFSRLNEAPVLPCVMVDFANSFTWTHSPWQIPMDRGLAELRHHLLPNGSAALPRLAPSFELLFTVLHLFREAWLQQGEDASLDVDLARFADVLRCFTSQRDEITRGEFCTLIDEFQLHDPVLWVLEHLDRTLGTDVVPSLGWEGRVSEEWLASARAPRGRQLRWQGTMRQCLHDRDSREFLTDHPLREGTATRPETGDTAHSPLRGPEG
jgi:hypothetical protein